MFSYKMVIFTGIWIFFALALPLHRHDHPMLLFPLTILAFSDWIGLSGYASHGAHGAHGHLFGCGRLGPIRLHLVIFSDVATTALFIQSLIYAVSTSLHEAWQRPLRKSSIPDRLHPIGFSRGGV